MAKMNISHVRRPLYWALIALSSKTYKIIDLVFLVVKQSKSAIF